MALSGILGALNKESSVRCPLLNDGGMQRRGLQTDFIMHSIQHKRTDGALDDGRVEAAFQIVSCSPTLALVDRLLLDPAWALGSYQMT